MWFIIGLIVGLSISTAPVKDVPTEALSPAVAIGIVIAAVVFSVVMVLLGGVDWFTGAMTARQYERAAREYERQTRKELGL